ncbi:MAG: nucleolar RNA-binding Nop10p family protein [Candidatus Caldarchaeales archaeon]|nr:nucleolar RNA-binding Nop10p family protein [Candidatus Caldarchaeales archaeon]MDT7915679.1 nucleolar RNA-binding Nop10p family protein [Candidatus Caldarchaeales archaeon]
MRLRRCSRCWRYTLRTDRCPVCGGELVIPHPPRALLSEEALKSGLGAPDMRRQRDELGSEGLQDTLRSEAAEEGGLGKERG